MMPLGRRQIARIGATQDLKRDEIESVWVARKRRACRARCEIRLACSGVREGALPGDVRLAAITARMFDEYVAGWKTDRNAHGASLAPYSEDLCGQTGLREVLCAFDDHGGVSRGALPE